MAVLTHTLGANAMGTMCGADRSPVAGMGAMYLLMSIFHAAPWLKLVADRTNNGNGRVGS